MKRNVFFTVIILFSIFRLTAQSSDFNADTLTGCVPMQVSFTDLSTGNPIAWDWDMGDGASHLYVQHPTYVFNTPGIYSITLTVTYADSSKKTKTIQNYITASSGPYVNFSSNLSAICPGQSIRFNDTILPGGANVKSCLWDFGDGGTSTSLNPNYIYRTPGTYKVSLVAYNQMGCATKVEKKSFITVYPKPTADFIVTDSVHCVNYPTEQKNITLTNKSNGHQSSHWVFADNTTSNAESPSKLFGIGDHDITLIVTNDKGCKDTMIKTKYISIHHFVASFTVSDTIICDMDTEVFFWGSSLAQYTWTFGDGGSSLGVNAKHTYRQPGKYTVSLYALSNLGCRDTVVKPNYITVYDSVVPTISIFENPHCDSNAVITFVNLTQYPSSDDFGLGTVVWYPEGDTNTAVYGDTATYVYGRYGEWYVKAIITTPYGCKVNSVSEFVQIYPMQQSHVVIDRHPGGCAPLTVRIDFGPTETSSPIVNYMWIWDTGDTTFSASPDTVQYTYSDTGMYNARVILTNAQGCVLDEDIPTIFVGFKPVCNWTSTPTKACKSDFEMPVKPYDSLDAGGNLVGDAYANSWTWFWKGKDVTRVGDTSFVLSFSDTGLINYASLVCYHNFCPSDTVTNSIYAYVCPPIAHFDSLSSSILTDPFCNVFPKLPNDINKSAGANLYRWNFGNDFDSTSIGGSNFQGDVSVDKNPNYQYKYGPYLEEKDGHIIITMACINDNTSIYNACGYCEDTARIYIDISYADMHMTIVDEDSMLIKEICQDNIVYFCDSTICTSSLNYWGMRIVDSALLAQAVAQNHPIENAVVMDTLMVYHRNYYDSTHRKREVDRKHIPVYFTNYGVYYAY
ncbi:MAG: PKD domain-containing protein, partial [Bacteroidales bacterium]|nr:PKD domain-containing protein [Bacteroidales bacterium]